MSNQALVFKLTKACQRAGEPAVVLAAFCPRNITGKTFILGEIIEHAGVEFMC